MYKKRAFDPNSNKVFFKSSPKDNFFHFSLREREREKEERDINVREKHGLVVSQTGNHTYRDRGLHPQPGHVPRLGIEPTSFLLLRWHSSELSHAGQGQTRFVSM